MGVARMTTVTIHLFNPELFILVARRDSQVVHCAETFWTARREVA